MTLLLEVSRRLTVTTDIDELLCEIAKAVTTLLDCERASIFLYDNATDELCTKVALQARTIRIPSGTGIAGAAFGGNCIVHVPDAYEDARFNQEVDRSTGYRTRNLLTAPMIDLDEKPVGVLQAVNKRQGAFGDSDLALVQLLSDEAGVAVQRHRLQQAALETLVLKREMDLARRVQEALIPREPPEVPGFDAVGWARPASTTGGDCFDLWEVGDGRLGVLLADASGHGLAPAMIVSQVRTLVRVLAQINPDPHWQLARVNERLHHDLEPHRFVTAFLGYLSPDGKLVWSSAGHGPVFARRSAGQDLQQLEVPCPPLGVLPAWTDEAPAPIHLAVGGTLVVVSDGTFEAPGADGTQFGVERLVDALNADPERRPADLMAAVRAQLVEWQGPGDPADDQTMVIVRRTPAGAGAGDVVVATDVVA